MKNFILLLTLLISNSISSQDGVRVYIQKYDLLYRQTAIIFSETTTDDVDICCDAILFGGSTLNYIWTYNGQTPYLINSFSPLIEDRIINLGSNFSPDTGSFIIGIDQVYGDTIPVKLIDSFVPGLHEMPYVCQAPVSNDRFKLYFEYPINIEAISGCGDGMLIIDNDNDSNYVLTILEDTVGIFPANTDTIFNLYSGSYNLNIMGENINYPFTIDNYLTESFIQTSANNVWLNDSYIEFIFISDDPISGVDWNFGDGNFINNDYNPVHNYTQQKFYKPYL